MRLGLIGKSLGYSFSAAYFAEKFKQKGLWNYSYQNFEIPSKAGLKGLLESEVADGYNVTIPYKEAVIPYLAGLSTEAEAIGAVNTLVFKEDGWHGENTDHIGFSQALAEQGALETRRKALVLGSGGASKAICFALSNADISYKIVSREPEFDSFTYQEAKGVLSDYTLVINTTPPGTFPHVEDLPLLIPEGNLQGHFFMDLIYNPEESKWLSRAKGLGAQVLNGKSMLVYQAEAAWDIWHSRP